MEINEKNACLYIDVHCYECKKRMALSTSREYDGRYYCDRCYQMLDDTRNLEMDEIEKVASDVWIQVKGGKPFSDQEFAFEKKIISDAILTYHKQRTQPLVDALEEYSKKENWDNGGFDFDKAGAKMFTAYLQNRWGWTYAQQVLSKYKEVENDQAK